MIRTSLAILLFLASAVAGPVNVTLDSVSPFPVSDGKSYVGPYSVDVDGVTYGALCFDVRDRSYIGETWKADLINGSDLSGAYFSNQPEYKNSYLSEMYLFRQIMATPLTDAKDRTDIQHAAWSLFDGGFTVDAGAQHWLELAVQGRSSIDPSGFAVLAGVPGQSPVPQGMLIEVPGNDAPEPGTMFFLGLGLIAVALIRVRR